MNVQLRAKDTRVRKTPLIPLGLPGTTSLWVKDETQQTSGAFKFRGSTNFLARNAVPSGVVCAASTGNHAIGLSTAAGVKGLTAQIFVPESCPPEKLSRIRAAGGEVTLVTGAYEDAARQAKAFARATGAVLVPSFDHADIVEGNCGIFREINESMGRAPERVIVPVGGGGLLAAALQSFDPSVTEIVGVEYDVFRRINALKGGMISEIGKPGAPVPPSIEGIAVRGLGALPLQKVRAARNLKVMQVSESDLQRAARQLWGSLRIKAELAACAGVAAVLSQTKLAAGGRTVCVISGGNVDGSVFREVVGDMAA